MYRFSYVFNINSYDTNEKKLELWNPKNILREKYF